MRATDDAARLDPDASRPRDAARTRAELLEAALRRFAADGYPATTSRDIAADVGVNVSLINRYFGSKEGLFEACLTRSVEEFDGADARLPAPSEIVRGLIEQVARTSKGDKPLHMLLLVRSSGDERADEIRRRTMRSFTERAAAVAGWSPDDPTTGHLLLRAQVAMALAFGISAIRASSDMEPLASASEQELSDPLRDVLSALLEIG